MLPPDLEGFDSETTPDGSGRLYRVAGEVSAVCYWLEDPQTLRRFGARGDGIYLYAFLSDRRVGRWQWTWAFGDVEGAMRRYRALEEGAPPGDEVAESDIQPATRHEFYFTRGGEPLVPDERPPGIALSLDDLWEPGPGADVIDWPGTLDPEDGQG